MQGLLGGREERSGLRNATAPPAALPVAIPLAVAVSVPVAVALCLASLIARLLAVAGQRGHGALLTVGCAVGHGLVAAGGGCRVAGEVIGRRGRARGGGHGGLGALGGLLAGGAVRGGAEHAVEQAAAVLGGALVLFGARQRVGDKRDGGEWGCGTVWCG